MPFTTRPGAARQLRRGRLDALARVGGGHGGARARRQRVRRGRRRGLHAPGRRAAPERPGRRPAGGLLAGVAAASRSCSARRASRRRRRRSSACARSGTTSCPGTGPLAACVPGRVRRLAARSCRSSGRGGSRTCSRFAIGYAEHGYPVVAGITLTIERVEPLLREWPASAELYLPAPQPGTTFRNPQLAATWKRLLDESRGGSREEEIERARTVFYEGFVAEEIDALLARERRAADRRRPARVARDARGAGDVRLPRAHRLQDGRRGARGRSACSSSRCSPASTSRT